MLLSKRAVSASMALAVFLLNGFMSPARAQDAPTVVVRIRSLDTVVDSVKLLGKIVGQDDAAQRLQGLIKAQVGADGPQGVDKTRPLGLYIRLGKEIDDVSGAILLPISDAKAFVKLIEGFDAKVEKGQNEIYSIKIGPPFETAYLRFANKYAYVTAINAAALDDNKLPDPAKLLEGKASSLFSATLRLDQVPGPLKLFALAAIEQKLQELKDEKIPNETEAQKDFRGAAQKEAIEILNSVIRDGAAISADVELDDKTGALAATFTLTGQEKSDLATGIQALTKSPSLFGGLLSKDAAFNALVRVAVPDGLRKPLDKVIAEGTAKALGSIQDPAKKKQAETLIQSITPTLRDGIMDGGFSLHGPTNGKFTMVGAARLKNGDKLGKTLHDLLSEALKDIPPAQRDKIRLEAASVGAVKVHQLDIPDLLKDDMLQKLVGDSNLYVAFRDDAVFVALGAGGMKAIKDAIAAPQPPTSPLFVYDVDVARLASVFAPAEQQDQAKKLFPKAGDGALRIRVEAGAALTVRFETRLAVLEFLSQVREVRLEKK